jgi:hypothetical protein
MATTSSKFEPATLGEKLVFAPIALALVSIAQVSTLFMSTRRVVEYSRHAAGWLADLTDQEGRADRANGSENLARTLHLIRVSLQRASEFVPGARCLHRSVSARVWLASLGIRSSVVVGVSRGPRPASERKASGSASGEPADQLESEHVDTPKFPADTGFHGHAWLEFDRTPENFDGESDMPATMFAHPDQDYTEVYRR